MTEGEVEQSPLKPYELAQLQLDAWKTTVGVQQHFNDIEMKVRGLALTLVTGLLGATAVAVENRAHADLGGASVPLATLLVATALIGWLFFAFMDRVWYHTLLLGAVRHGESLEKTLGAVVPGMGLATAISKASPWIPPRPIRWIVRRPLHSKDKMSVFYSGMALLLAALLVATLFVPEESDGDSGEREGQTEQVEPEVTTER